MKNSTMFVNDDILTFPRWISNDSGISFGDSDHESIHSDDDDDDNEKQIIAMNNDACLASMISDEEKKFICENPHWIWHGEFGRLIMTTAMKYHLDYRLILVDDISPQTFNRPFPMIKSDNAKAQFKCQHCQHAWTSMRARCSFYLAEIDHRTVFLLKLYAQQCQYCYSTVHPRWYYDEICRVMKNFARTIFENSFPFHDHFKPIRRSFQRKGSMHHPHQSFLCEACRSGYCY